MTMMGYRSVAIDSGYRQSYDHRVVAASARGNGRSALLHVAGEVDLASAQRLERALEGELAAGHVYLRLDLSGVTFVDTAALAALRRAHERFLAARGTLVLIGISPTVARLLQVTGQDRVLLIADPHLEQLSA